MALEYIKQIECIVSLLAEMAEDERMEAINVVREKLHAVSPMKDEPVDYVAWVKAETVYANDYNPNSVAPPEMELLAHSIMQDGYTQPIVTCRTDFGREVVDGFHRNRVGKENAEVAARVKGYLPVVQIKSEQSGKQDRMAATIRHNRARGKHKIDAMSEIVVELKRRNWSPKKIGKELGMDQDEVLRLCQISGLNEMFSDKSFSEAWEADNEAGVSPVLEMGGDEFDDVALSGEQRGNAA